MEETTVFHRSQWSDTIRVGIMIVIGAVLLMVSTPIALAVDEPALAPWGMWAGLAVFGAAVSHVLRRLFFPYVDLATFCAIARESATGAGLVVLGVCIVIAALVLTTSSARAAEIPPNARLYLPVLLAEQFKHWPDAPDVAAMAGQVEQETCISLTHKRCWSPMAELRTARERGVGLGQVTRTSRFDALAENVALHRELKGWSWNSETLYDPNYQLRALVLTDRRNYKAIVGAAGHADRLAMMLVSYNAGPGRVLSDRRLCSGTRGCDQSRWFGHAEHTSLLPKKAANGYGKSFYQISREYPRLILLQRRTKYVGEIVRARIS